MYVQSKNKKKKAVNVEQENRRNMAGIICKFSKRTESKTAWQNYLINKKKKKNQQYKNKINFLLFFSLYDYYGKYIGKAKP